MMRTFWPRWLLAAAGVLAVAGCPNSQQDAGTEGAAAGSTTADTAKDAFQANIDEALRSHTGEVPLISSSSEYMPDQPGNIVFEIRPCDLPPDVPIPPGAVVPGGHADDSCAGGGGQQVSSAGTAGHDGGGGGGGQPERGELPYSGSLSARRYVRCDLVVRGRTYVQDGWQGPKEEPFSLSTSQDGRLTALEITRYSVWSDFLASNLSVGASGTFYEDPAGEAVDRNYRVQYTVLDATQTGPSVHVVLSLRVDIWSLGAIWAGTGTQTTDITFSGNSAAVNSRVEYFVVMDTKPVIQPPEHYDAHHIWEIQGTLNR